MKKSTAFLSFVIILFSIFTRAAFAQMPDPVHVTCAVDQNAKDEATLLIHVKIDDHWHIFSLDHAADIGLPVVIAFTADDANYSLAGNPMQPNPVKEIDTLTKSTLLHFSGKVTFKQSIKISSTNPFKVNGIFTFQACNDEGCVPPVDVPISFELNAKKK